MAPSLVAQSPRGSLGSDLQGAGAYDFLHHSGNQWAICLLTQLEVERVVLSAGGREGDLAA